MQTQSYTKYILWTSVVVVLVIGYILVGSLRSVNKIVVDIETLPDNATAYINDKKIGKGTTMLTPGTYTFKATSEGFADDEYSVTITNKPVSIILLPTPQSEEAKALYEDKEERLKIEELGSARADTIGKNTRQENTIINRLPIDMFTYKDMPGPFSLDYGPSTNRENSMFLLVNNSSPNGRKNAIQWIIDQGYNTADLEILFSDYSNPLIGTS